MRIKTALILTAAAAAFALPAAAQTYQRNCANTKNSSQVGGAIVGSIIGGVLGSNVAASGHRGDGTTVGAVLGGLVGAGVGGGSVRCDALPPPAGTYAPGYGNPYGGYPQPQPYGYSPAPANTYPVDPGYSGYGYQDDGYNDRDRGRYGNSELYRGEYGSYNRNDDYAGRDCSTATQITRLPDGTVIRRPVEACRDAYYGDWQVRN